MTKSETSEPVDDYFIPGGGLIWHRLHSERDKVCAALLNQLIPVTEATTAVHEMEPADESTRDVERKRKELLQARLCRIDDALDRLMSGSYGHCSECGKQIEDKRISEDPAVSNCISCQSSSEPDQDFPTI